MIPPHLVAGARARGQHGGAGQIGLLVANSDMRPFALTTATIAGSARTILVEIGGKKHMLQAEDFPYTSDGFGDDCLTAFALPEWHAIAANAAGVSAMGKPIDAVAALDLELIAHLRNGPAMCRLVGIGASARFQNGENEFTIDALIALESLAGSPLCGPGDAGALIATADSRPLGLIIGATSTGMLATPLASFLRVNGLAPLSMLDAVVHHSRMRQIAPAETEEPDDVGAACPVFRSSDEILSEAGLEALVADVGAA